ncbi:MAG: hypothetical protein ACRD0W_00895 [Acidimicrobiales bacterium]
MIVSLLDTQPGDRFLGADGEYWTVLSVTGGVVKASRPGRPTHSSAPAPDLMVDVMNRDDSLTMEGAVTNLVAGGLVTDIRPVSS